MMRAYPPPTTTKEGFVNHAWRGKFPMMTAKIRKGFWIQWLKIASIKQVIVIDVIEMLNWDTLESTTLLKWPVFWICSCNPTLTPLTSGITCIVICIYIYIIPVARKPTLGPVIVSNAQHLVGWESYRVVLPTGLLGKIYCYPIWVLNGFDANPEFHQPLLVDGHSFVCKIRGADPHRKW